MSIGDEPKRQRKIMNVLVWLNWQSSWLVISRLSVQVRSSAPYVVEFPSGQRGQTVNLLSDDFEGSNPSSTTIYKKQNIDMLVWLNWQSSWLVISRLSVQVRSSAPYVVEFPSGQRGQTVNLLSDDFEGSNPSSTTRKRHY